MKRKDFARLAAALAHEVTYYNFKDEVHCYHDQDNKAGPYMEVWSAMRQAQRAEDPPRARKLDWWPEIETRGAPKDSSKSLRDKRTK